MTQPVRPGDEPEFTVPVPVPQDATEEFTEVSAPTALIPTSRTATSALPVDDGPAAGVAPLVDTSVITSPDPYGDVAEARTGPSWVARFGSALFWMVLGGWAVLGLRVLQWLRDGEISRATSPRIVLDRLTETFGDTLWVLAIGSALATFILFAARGRRWLGVLSLLVTLATWFVGLNLIRFFVS